VTDLDLSADAIQAEKTARQQALLAALSGPLTVDRSGDPRERLAAKLGPDALAELDEKLLALLSDESAGPDEQDEPPGVFAAIAKSQAERRAAITDALLGRRAPAAPRPQRAHGFDGGARATIAPPPPTEGEWLGTVLRSRSADVGRSL
jgi:hypothetical protein